MTVRLATINDLPALVGLHKASFEANWDEDALLPFVLMGAVTCVGLPVAGFVIITHVGEEGEIITLAVAPDQRRKGIALALLTQQMAALEHIGVRSLFLEVAIDNQAALCLYGAIGFVEVGLRKDYYRQNDGTYKDARVLSRQLKSPPNVAKR
jgi:[ribosomal protein S18]-alanine N-acetyltransferase